MLKKAYLWLLIISGILISPTTTLAATLTLNPASGVLNKGCEVTIKVDLDTQGVQTDGTDVILIYTPSQLTTSISQITNGTIYPEYPGNSIDPTGKISISGISSVSNPYSGSGTFATIKFKVADTLAANTPLSLKFDFDPNNKTKTTDTNVVERGTIADVLNSVTDGSYTVGTGSCTSGSAAGSGASGTAGAAGSANNFGQGQALPGSTTTSASSSAQYPVYKPDLNQLTGNGKSSGFLDNTITLSILGGVLVVLGIAGLALL